MPSPIGHAIGGIAGAWTAAGRPAGPREWFGEALLFAAIGAVPDVDLLFGAHSGPTHSIGAAVIAGIFAWVLVKLIVVLDAATAGAVPGTDITPEPVGLTASAEATAVRRPAFAEGYGGSAGAGEGGSFTRRRKADTTPGAGRLNVSATRIAVAVAAAWASHMVLDWLGEDTSAPFGVMALWPYSGEHFMSPVTVMPAITRRYWLPGFWMQNFRALLFELAVLLPVLAAVWIARRVHLRRGRSPEA